ncbi:MAG: ABC transporter ATP-binding protein, partial [Cohaesibacter sp.]|nr:ABC transporter ATP-binding protein [Cohaesibacter sp.]
MAPVLDVNCVSKCYTSFSRPHQRLLSFFMPGRRRAQKDFWALKDISFTLDKGETIGIIGRNGSGKSTLLQIICGVLNPTDGSVALQGRVAALLELGAGFNPDFSGRENIYLNAAIYGLSKKQVDARLGDIIAFADIGEFIDHPVRHYSSGMFVRLAFAVIAHVDADVLIIDEALAVGDALFAQKCMRFLEAFKSHGSILFVSHDSGSITRFCDRAI